MTSTTIIPTSGVVLACIVDHFQLKLPDGTARTAREYFAGRRRIIKDKTRIKIFRAVGKALVRQGYVPEFAELESKQKITTADALASSLAHCAEHWDQLAGRLQSEGLHDGPLGGVAVACLRLAVVDFAVRAAAGMRLAYGRPEECTCDLCVFGDVVRPKWPHAGGQRSTVKAIVEQVGAASLEEFASQLGFADGTIDGWVKPANPSRPKEEALEALATALARLDPDDEDARESWLLGFRWRFALAAIAEKLSPVIGRPNVIDLGWGLERCFFFVAEFFRRSGLGEDVFPGRMLITLTMGVHDPGAEHILNALRKQEADEDWLRACRTAGNDWFIAVLSKLSGERSKERVAGTLADEQGLAPVEASLVAEVLERSDGLLPPSLVTTALAKSTVMAGLAHTALKSGDLAAAATYLEGASAEDPLRPELHQDLGAVLGLLGRHDEGLTSCRRAIELRPGWPPPLIQVGILLLDAGRDAEALEHLEDVAPALPWTITLGHTLGVARLRALRYRQATEALERVLQEEPEHALALDALAHCCLKLRKWKRGRELAKRAHSLGVHQTYQALKAGRYGGAGL